MKKNISKDFTWEEMTYSCIAIVNGLRNDPPKEARCAICELVKCLLQPLRIAFNKPIAITCGYRSPEVNRLAGGVRSSQAVAHSDSLSLSQQLQTTCFQKVRLEHIELSPPDSLKKQYICSVTRLTEDREAELLTTISGDMKKEETLFVNKEENVVTNKATKISSSFWWGVVLLLVVIFLLYLCTPIKRKYISNKNMKRIFCPKCDNQLSFDETKYPDGQVLAFVCPQCGSQFKIKLGRKIIRTESGQEKEVKEPDFSCGYITVIENTFGFKQDLPLILGDNMIGRRNKDTEGVDAPIITSDPSVGRKHCIINVKQDKEGRFIYTLRDNQSMTGTFLRSVILGKKEQVRIGEGAIVTMGATTFILHTANKEEEEEF